MPNETINTRHTPKQRIRNVLQNLNKWFPKFAIQRFAEKIQNVWDANELENPEVEKLLQELLDNLKKSKTAKTKAGEMEDMPSDFGWEKTPEEIAAEKKLNKRTGQVERVVVTGTVASPTDGGGAATVPPSPSGQPGASAKVDAKVSTTSGQPVNKSEK